MYQIDLQRVRIVGAGLSAQEAVLGGVVENLRNISVVLEEMTLGNEVGAFLSEIRKNINDDRAALHQMTVCLEEIEIIYRKAERRIADRYDLEYVTYPKTEFGISQITGLEQYKNLLVFDA